MNGAACDSFKFVWNCIFLFYFFFFFFFFLLQITCNAYYTYDVLTKSKLPVPFDIEFYTCAGYCIYRCSMMTVVQISFETSLPICSNASYDTVGVNNLTIFLISTRKSVIFAFFTKSFLHHRHLHAITGAFSYLLKNTASSEGY